MTALRQRREIPLSSLATCQDCAYQGFCTGGCPGGAVYATGDFNTRDPMSCYRVLKGEDPFLELSTDAGNLNIGEQNG
jgi:sulfatase maturation enzyme AslB (radical SAM superfamily)